MSEQARPWWASDGPVEGGIAPDEDPVERFRSARRGPSAPGRPEVEAEPWLEAAAATMSRLARELSRETEGSDAPAADGSGADAPGAGAPGADAPGADAPGADTLGAQDSGADGSGGRGAQGSGPDATGEGTWAQGPPPHSLDVCGVCPICIGLRTLAESRPELMGHLAEAARHVTLAARSFMERPERPHGGEDDEPLEHIDLD